MAFFAKLHKSFCREKKLLGGLKELYQEHFKQGTCQGPGQACMSQSNASQNRGFT